MAAVACKEIGKQMCTESLIDIYGCTDNILNISTETQLFHTVCTNFQTCMGRHRCGNIGCFQLHLKFTRPGVLNYTLSHHLLAVT